MKYLLNGEESQRLKFRLLKPSDFDQWKKLFTSKQTILFLGLDPKLSPEVLTANWFKKVFDGYESDLGGMNVLVEKNNDQLVGQCGLMLKPVEEIERMEIGYAILPEYWNCGFATEAAVKCKEYAFENNLRNELISLIDPDNIASEKVAEKNGMTLKKKLDDYKGVPVNIFSITKEMYLLKNKLH